MAIDFGEQGLVDSGRSSVSIPDTYVPIRGSTGAGDNAESLARALSGLAGTFDNMDKARAAKDKENYLVHSQQLQAAMEDGRTPTDEDVNNILSKVHPLARARAAEDAGYNQALIRGRDYLVGIPATLPPEEASAAYNAVLKRAAEDSKGNISYQQGFLQGVNALLRSRANSDNEARVATQRTQEREAFQGRLNDGFTNTIKQFKKDGTLPPDPMVMENQTRVEGGFTITDMSGKPQPSNFKELQPETQAKSVELANNFGKDLRITPHGGTQPDKRSKTSQHSIHNRKATDYYIADLPDEEKTRLVATAISMGAGGVGAYSAGDGVGTIHIDWRGKPGKGPNGVALWHRNKPGVDDSWTTGPQWYQDGVRQGMAALEQGVVITADGERSLSGKKFASADTGVMSDGTVIGDAPAQKANQYLDDNGNPLNPLQISLQKQFIALDEEYKRTGLRSNGERRDDAAEILIQLAKDSGDESLLNALPSRILTKDLRDKFREARTSIKAEGERKKDQLAQDSLRAQKVEVDKKQSEMIDKFSKGEAVNPAEISSITYPDVNGKMVTLRDRTLFNAANELNKSNVYDEFDSKVKATNYAAAFGTAFLTGDFKTAFKDYPEVMAFIGDKTRLSDKEALEVISKLSVNQSEKLALIQNIDNWKNSYSVIQDKPVQDLYNQGLGKTVAFYNQRNTLGKDMAVIDPILREKMANIEGDVRAHYETVYYNEYMGWMKKNPGDTPDWGEQKELIDKALKSAKEFYLEQTALIDGMTLPGSKPKEDAGAFKAGTVVNGSYQGTTVSGQVLSDNGQFVIVRSSNGQEYVIPKADVNGTTRPFSEYDASVESSQVGAPVIPSAPIDTNIVTEALNTFVPPVVDIMGNVGQGIADAYNSFDGAAKYKPNPISSNSKLAKRLDTTSPEAIEVERKVTEWASDPANAERANKLLEEASTPMRKDRDYEVLYNRWNDATDTNVKAKALNDLENFMKKYRLDYVYSKMSK